MPSPHSESNSTKIFISYRRSESAAHAGRLSDQLSAHFGRRVVFIDTESIEPGRDFVEDIEAAVGSCKILLAVIGRQWLTCTDERGRRLDDPKDFVRLEIAAALRRGVRVIPVLVQGATMPREEDLPAEVAPLARKQAWEVSDLRWKDDVRKLIKKIKADIRQPDSLPPPKRTHTSGSPLASWVFGGFILVFLMLVVFLPVESSKFPIIRFLMALSAAFFAIFFVGGVLLRGTLKSYLISASGGFVLFVLIQFVYDPFRGLRNSGVEPSPTATATATPTATPAVTPTPAPGADEVITRPGVTPSPTPTPTPKPPRPPAGKRRASDNCNAEDILLGRCPKR